MDEGSRDRTEERRRRGPLGDEGSADAETRRVPIGEEWPQTERRSTAAEGGTRPRRRRVSAGDDGGSGTREMRAPHAETTRGVDHEEATYPRGYLEALEEREARLREVYGGVDWLASFIGCVFAIVSGGVLLTGAVLALGPLGVSPNLEAREIGTAAITGLAVIGVALFLAFFFGGYVAGRLARFDGGRNGAMTVFWTFALILLAAAAGTAVGVFFRQPLFEASQDFVQNSALPAVGRLTEVGLVGAGILVGALLLVLLGGFLGGRAGKRYHTRINRTT